METQKKLELSQKIQGMKEELKKEYGESFKAPIGQCKIQIETMPLDATQTQYGLKYVVPIIHEGTKKVWFVSNTMYLKLAELFLQDQREITVIRTGKDLETRYEVL